jgi:ubiquitin carboxyl-terminal hydrolase 5/13
VLSLKGEDPERAVEWLFSHPDDTGEDDTRSGSLPTPAKTNCGGSSQLPAKYRLRAFISHKGPSVHSGHYVVHIRNMDGGEDENSGWVLFNDEKVVKADRESVKDLKRFAYLYIFERLSSVL